MNLPKYGRLRICVYCEKEFRLHRDPSPAFDDVVHNNTCSDCFMRHLNCTDTTKIYLRKR